MAKDSQRGDAGGYQSTPRIVQTFGRLNREAFGLLSWLAGIAAESSKVSKAHFMANTLNEMSAGLCRGSRMMLAAGRKVLMHVTGTDVQRGLAQPTAEMM